MQLIIRMFHRSDMSRSRAMVQEVAEKRLEARRNLAEADRNAARALADAKRLDEEDFRTKFEKRLAPRSAFLPSIIPAGGKPTVFDAWEFARLNSDGNRAKPRAPFPVRALYTEQQAAA